MIAEARKWANLSYNGMAYKPSTPPHICNEIARAIKNSKSHGILKRKFLFIKIGDMDKKKPTMHANPHSKSCL